MTEWLIAGMRAEQLQAEHPGWRVRPVRRRDGAGVEAIRDEGGLCSLTGGVSEVREALAATAQCSSDAARPADLRFDPVAGNAG
jgi:hypothetical protein